MLHNLNIMKLVVDLFRGKLGEQHTSAAMNHNAEN